MSNIKITPSSKWKVKGEVDPHGTTYDCERHQLAMGDLTDDEMANAVFLHGDAKLSVSDLLSGVTPPIVYLMAAKDRIRWLSRKGDAKQERIAELEEIGLKQID